MAREFWYRLQQVPSGALDGSGKVLHDIYSVYSDDGGVTKIITPGYHKTVALDASSVETVMDMPDSTGPEKQAKNAAYKDLMELHIEDPPYSPPPKYWDETSMNDYTVANDNAVLQASRVNDYIVVTLGQSYPVDFKLE